jgi:glycosyltransferase involved in cell wall biosynthesis
LGFIHPQEEDAGIAAIEAMAAGTPVIAFSAGGAKETVLQDITGKLFEEQTWQSLADAVIRLKKQTFDYNLIREHSKQYSQQRFMADLKNFVETKYMESR